MDVGRLIKTIIITISIIVFLLLRSCIGIFTVLSEKKSTTIIYCRVTTTMPFELTMPSSETSVYMYKILQKKQILVIER